MPLVSWLSRHLVVCTMASRASRPAGCRITSSSAPRPPVPLVRLVVVSPCRLHCGVNVYGCIVVVCIFPSRLHRSPSSGLRRHCLQAASLSTLSSIVCVAVSSSALTSATSSASSSAAPWLSPIDVCINVNLFLFQLNIAIVGCKSMPTEELSPSRGLDSKAKSCIRCEAGNDKKHLVVVGLQTELTGEVAAMVVARIERKAEGLGVGDEC
jgi:hypothetical protein